MLSLSSAFADDLDDFHVFYALYEITHLQYMFVIYLFYYTFTLIWLFYIKINIHKKNSYIHIFCICILYVLRSANPF
jgi:hypothetical protein